MTIIPPSAVRHSLHAISVCHFCLPFLHANLVRHFLHAIVGFVSFGVLGFCSPSKCSGGPPCSAALAVLLEAARPRRGAPAAAAGAAARAAPRRILFFALAFCVKEDPNGLCT